MAFNRVNCVYTQALNLFKKKTVDETTRGTEIITRVMVAPNYPEDVSENNNFPVMPYNIATYNYYEIIVRLQCKREWAPHDKNINLKSSR